MARLALLLFALALLLPQVAEAAFVPTTAPFPADSQIDEFDANDARWIAAGRVEGEPRVAVSDNQGASWSTVVQPDDSSYRDVSAAADGSLWMSGRKTSPDDAGGVVYRIAPGSLTPTPVTYTGFGLGTNAGSDYVYETSAPLWDAAGQAWVTVTVSPPFGGDDITRHLVELGASGGAVTHRTPLVTQSYVALDRLGSQVYVIAGDIHRLDGTTLTTVPQVPKWRSGQRAVDAGGARSSDGGASFEGGTSWMVRAVQNAPDLAISGPSVLSTHAAGLAPTGLTDAPEGWLDAVRTDDGIALPGQDGVVYFHAGAVPPVPAATGMQLKRLNVLRAVAGLAPVREDARLAQASAAHVNYWKLNDFFSGHDESSGLPGFTGFRPSDRCLAAGYLDGCGEVAYPQRSTWAVDGWLATPYHGRPLVAPDATDLGGAEIDGIGANINVSSPRAIRFTPAPFPIGSYDGELLATGESPDPVDACLDSGQNVDWPLGSAVFLNPPTGGSASVSGLARAADGVALAGCKLEGMFLPDEPLAPNTTYRATGVWTGGYEAPDQPITWEFTTGAGHGAGITTITTTTTTTTVTTGSVTRPGGGGAGLRLGLAGLRVPRLSAFARKGLALPITCAPACRATAKLTSKLGTLGKSARSALSSRPALRVKVAKRLRKRVRRLRKLTVQIVVTASAEGGAPVTLRHKITLRR